VSYEAFKDLQEALSEYSGFLSINETNTTRNTGGICTFCKKTAFKKVSYSGLLCEGSSKCGKLAIRPALFAQLTLNNNAQVTIVNTKLRRCNVVVPNDGVWNHLHFLLKKIPKEFVLFMGDFNRPPGHFLIKDVMEAGLEDVFAKEGRPTCFANGIVKRIDYIFASKDLVTFPLSCSLLTDKEPIPNRNEPSDHVPILCHVTVK
jgi:endonuclease/exonuclease/phosphatase family metal-dependent hydrolase